MTPTTGLDLADFFSATEARNDRWSAMAAVAQEWEAAGQGPSAEHLRGETVRLLGEVAPLEHYWAYPGPNGMGALVQAIAEGAAPIVARLTRKISTALLTGYRHPTAMRDPLDGGDATLSELLPPDSVLHEPDKPSFEVMIVTPHDPSKWEQTREVLARLRRREDPFRYEVVQVGSFEDAVIGAIFNQNLQAVVLYDGFQLRSHHGLAVLREFLQRHWKVGPGGTSPHQLTTTLVRALKRYRPELDIYLITDRAVEAFAGSEDAAPVRRIFYQVEELLEVHLALLEGVAARYETPFFATLKHNAQRPVGTFHALPIARGKSVFRSRWIRDMGDFYGTNLFLAESSATTGGLDSLLEPTGNIKKAQQLAARAFGAKHAYFGTNGTSTSNKIVVQALCAPGDIVIVDRNCHKSHHYGFVLSGAQPYYVEAFPLTQYSMYGAVPLRALTDALLTCKADGVLDRVKLVNLTNCTFDGHVYNVRRVMEACLAIKPDLAFLWDEAWFGFARFNPLHRRRTAMAAAAALAAERNRNYRVRVYQTHSTHKSMSALRQGSMILVWDEDFHIVESRFEEAFFTHTSTSPNLQVIASLDLARRQMELEGYELTMQATELALRIRREVNAHPLISKYFKIATPEDMIPAELRASSLTDYGPPVSTWRDAVEAWEEDEIVLDPTRLTLVCGSAGFDGTQLKNLLAERFDIQVNKTSRNSVLVQININNTRSDAALLIKVLCDLSREIEQRLHTGGGPERARFLARVVSLMTDVPDLPDFSRFDSAFRESPETGGKHGDIRGAFFAAYDDAHCEYVPLASEMIDRRLAQGPDMVSATFVIPYPPGFPIMVPGQVITTETIAFMRKLDVEEIHGYHAGRGLKLLTPAALHALADKRRTKGEYREQAPQRREAQAQAQTLREGAQEAPSRPVHHAGVGQTRRPQDHRGVRGP